MPTPSREAGTAREQRPAVRVVLADDEVLLREGLASSEGPVEKHVRSILGKLDLPESETDHRRVLAVLKFLEAR